MSDSFKVLDSFKFKDGKIFLKKYHIERSVEACKIINPQMDATELVNIYEIIEENYAKVIQKNQILRLLLSPSVALEYKAELVLKSDLPAIPTLQLIAELKQAEGVGKQNYKWSDREFWSAVMKLRSRDADDVVCQNRNGEVTETSRCNLFFYEKTSDQVFTPLLQSGCINGVYRRYVMNEGSIMLPELGLKAVREKVILPSEIESYTVYIANSVREVVKARMLTCTR